MWIFRLFKRCWRVCLIVAVLGISAFLFGDFDTSKDGEYASGMTGLEKRYEQEVVGKSTKDKIREERKRRAELLKTMPERQRLMERIERIEVEAIRQRERSDAVVQSSADFAKQSKTAKAVQTTHYKAETEQHKKKQKEKYSKVIWYTVIMAVSIFAAGSAAASVITPQHSVPKSSINKRSWNCDESFYTPQKPDAPMDSSNSYKHPPHL